MMISKQTIDDTLNRVSDRMMNLKNSGMEEKFPISLIDMHCWEWPQGVGLYGLYKYYEKTKNPEILAFLIKWFDERIEEGILEKNVNTTAPMLTLTYIYEITKKESYLELIEEWVAWIMEEKGLIRTGDDCFQHMITKDPNQGEILIDTLFMTLLFLARAGKLLERQDCIDEANFQVLNHIKYLYNKKEGLFYHGWNFDHNHNYGEVLWGRGNSWYTLGILELLEIVEVNPAISRYFLNTYRYQVEALKKYQNPSNGLWHTVIPDDTSYVETSASAAFLCGIMKGIRLGILDSEQYDEVVVKGVKGILEYINEEGIVENVSYGTPIGYDAEFYKQIAISPMTYGQALMIVMLQELMEDYWIQKIEKFN